MLSFSGSGAKSITALFTATVEAWYDLRCTARVTAFNGGPGVVIHTYVNGVDKVGVGGPYVYPAGALPLGTILGFFNLCPQTLPVGYSFPIADGSYAPFYLKAGDTLSFSVEVLPAHPSSWTADFFLERLGDEI